MKTPEQILDEVAAENMINIQQMVTTKQLAITAIRRYARIYHQNKVKNFGISGVINSRLYELEEENRKLKFMVENGLGAEDLENDCL